jgi:acyl-CoA dehydrogenase family protein 9
LRSLSPNKQQIVENREETTNETRDSLNKSKQEEVSSEHARFRKQIVNEPFVKSLFCEKYIYEYLKFPEYEHNYEIENLNKNFVQPLKDYLKLGSLTNENGCFTSSAINKLKELKVFSQYIPIEYGGSELDSIGSTRLLEEFGIYPSLGINLIYNYEIAARMLLYYGNKEQKEKYLPLIAKGELKIAFCYSESENGCDSERFKLVSTVSGADKFVLNGQKSWVSILTSDMGDSTKLDDILLLVLSKNQTKEHGDNSESKSLNAFLVESSHSGVHIQKQHSNEHGLNLYQIGFDNVQLTSKHLLGAIGNGFEISNKVVENTRHSVGALCVGLLKNLFKDTIEFTINSQRFEKSLSEYLLIKEKIANIEAKIYVMESMTYLTSGIIDSYQMPDVGCEAALTKIYCTEALQECVESCLEIMAMSTYKNMNATKRNYLKDLDYLKLMLNTNDFLKMYVATNGIILAGIELNESVRKLRNPLYNFSFILKQIMVNHRLAKSINKKQPQYLYLWEHVHPSLSASAAILEQSAVKFMMSVKANLVNHGRDALTYQTSMKNLAEMAKHIYAMNASIARASRSYSIGLPQSTHELALVHMHTHQANLLINELHQKIVWSNKGSGVDNTVLNVADQVFKSKEHAAVHSTSRNY